VVKSRKMTLAKAEVVLIDCVHKTPKAVVSGRPYVGIPQMKDGRIEYDSARKISEIDYHVWRKKARPQLHDVILSRRTNPGVTAVVTSEKTEFALGQNLVLLRSIGETVYPPFLKWLTQSPEWWSEIDRFRNVGAVFDSLKCRDVPNFRFTIPDKADQIAIAKVLDALDDKIELNRRTNQTLEAMVQAIFKDWFVDFGPVRRKMQGETDPICILGSLIDNSNQAATLTALFPDTLGDNGLPEGWTFEELVKSVVLQRGFDLPKPNRIEGDYPIIAASGFSGTHNEYKVLGPGICTGRSGVLGDTFYVRENFWPLNTSLWVKEYPNATALYAYFLLNALDLERLNAGSAVPTLNRNHAHQLPIVSPPRVLIDAFDRLATSFFDKIGSNERGNLTLAQTRDYLLPKLMSGQINAAGLELVV